MKAYVLINVRALRTSAARFHDAREGRDERHESWSECRGRFLRNLRAGYVPAASAGPSQCLVLGDGVRFLQKLEDLMAQCRRIAFARLRRKLLTAVFAVLRRVHDDLVDVFECQKLTLGALVSRLTAPTPTRRILRRPWRCVERVLRRGDRGVLRVQTEAFLQLADSFIQLPDDLLEFRTARTSAFSSPSSSCR